MSTDVTTATFCITMYNYQFAYYAARPILTHISLVFFLWGIGKGADPDQTLQNEASDQGLHCLLTEYSIKIWKKWKKNTNNNHLNGKQPLKWKWTGPIDQGRKVHLT